MKEMKVSASKPNSKRMVLSTMIALVAAEYAGTLVEFVLAAFAGSASGLGIPGTVVIGVFASLFAVPFTLLMTWKAVLVVIVIGEVLGRPRYFYPVAGMIAAHWIDYSALDADRGDWFSLTVMGGVAG